MKRQQKVELLAELVESIVEDASDVFIVFIDLCNSTKYKQRCIDLNQPDLTWISRQLIFLQRAARIINNYEGIVVKTIGDEVFAYYHATTNPESVLKSAIEVIQGYENLKAYKGDSKIEAKASIDFGRAYNGSIVESVPFDPIGLVVDRCARLNSIAINNEILFSKSFLKVVQEKIPHEDFLSKYGYISHDTKLEGIGKTKYYSIIAR